ncbi:EAL domain-containing protein [Marinobacter halodurans]|uniref:EAL domain-containing protein n=1 Tax=Marinobacter halodurans TaxID=2528979 RepID=A0ABY1ZHS1_9GAMM|nr:GGDEF domain-containing response regulator [Marinobacter halodurans]TBW53339.1 EAL domain-containing protein [Marinobacter halodurans]
MKRKTVLLVDDNPGNLKLLVDSLEGENLNVAVAQQGEEALQRLQRTHLKKPDLILLDVMMPGIGGYETCRRIKSEPDLADIPIIFLSALTDTDEKIAGFAMGAVDYITKPINCAELIARVNTHLELSDLRKRLDQRIKMRTQELVDANNSLRHEIEERLRAEKQIRYIATHDLLTDLPNRVLFEDRLNQLFVQAKRRNEKVVLMFLDLDQFKIINDSLGHQIGDKLILEVSKRLKGAIRAEDSIARFGGDEFALCFPTRDCQQEIELIVKNITDSFRKPFIINDLTIHASASIGIAIYPDDGTDADTLMRNADTAMHHAKQSGRAEARQYTAELNRHLQDHLNLSNLLRDAIENHELFLEYQPQVDLNTGKIIGAEALMRWSQGDGRLVSPAEFIPVAEATGLIKDLGELGLRLSCRELKRWIESGYDDLSMSVNISVPQLHATGFVETIEHLVNEFRIPPSLLKLEITESLLMEHSEAILNILKRLSDFGIQLSVDDFGTGYSSLAYLQDFPVNDLKIDITFIRNIGTEHGNAIPSAIIAMAHSLHLKVVAEGIEHNRQREFLRSRGCDYAQGFLYSRPVSGEEFLEKCSEVNRGITSVSLG